MIRRKKGVPETLGMLLGYILYLLFKSFLVWLLWNGALPWHAGYWQVVMCILMYETVFNLKLSFRTEES